MKRVIFTEHSSSLPLLQHHNGKQMIERLLHTKEVAFTEHRSPLLLVQSHNGKQMSRVSYARNR